MGKGLRIGSGIILVLAVLIFIGANIYCRNEAIDFVHNTREEQETRWAEEYEAGVIQGLREIPITKPEATGLTYEEVTVTNNAGMKLNGWYMPSQNGAAVMLLHGVTAFPYHMMEEAAILQRHGYGALLITVRNHNFSDGDTVSFGCDDREMADMDAWYQFLIRQEGVDPERIGLMGQSMGGSLAIQYASQNEGIRALATHSAFSSVDDALESQVAWQAGLPKWVADLIAGSILFWAKREVDCDLSAVSAKNWISEISPRPVFILHGGGDEQIPADSGKLLYDSAGDPKLYWLCPGSGHHECDTDYPQEFEERIIEFFGQYLLGA